MTPQETFDFVAQKLLTQGVPSIDKEKGECMTWASPSNLKYALRMVATRHNLNAGVIS